MDIYLYKYIKEVFNIKRIVVAGCRDYNNYDEAKEYIDICIEKISDEDEIIFVSGACRGADKLGERYAEENGFNIERYPAQWSRYGKSAGLIRNREMAEVSDYIICFWDGKSKGTKLMIDIAKDMGKFISVKLI